MTTTAAAAAAAAATSALLFHSTNPGTALGGRRQRSTSNHSSRNNSNTTPNTNTNTNTTPNNLSTVEALDNNSSMQKIKTTPSKKSGDGGGVAIAAGGILIPTSAQPRLFKSDAANNYYNAMKMKNALQTQKSVDHNNNEDDAAPLIANTKNVAGATAASGCTGGEHKKTSFASNNDNQGAIPTTRTALQQRNEIALISSPASPTQQGRGGGGGAGTIPPITSFDWSCAGGDQRDILSATSSITHCDSFLHPTDSFCSITTEEAAAAAAEAAAKATADSAAAPTPTPTAPATTTATATTSTVDASQNNKKSNDDPPIAEYPSPVCTSPDDNHTTYDSCATHAASALVVVVPNELKLDVIAEGSETENGMSSCSRSNNNNNINNNNKEMDESIEQDLQSYQAMSTSTVSNEKSHVAMSAIKDGKPPRDEISHARNVVDALNGIGPSKVSKPTNHVPTMKLRSVRSMSPSLFKKKKYPTDNDGRGDEVISASASLSSTKGSVLPTSKNAIPASSSSSVSLPRASKITMRSVRSMSPSFFNVENNKKETTTITTMAKKKNSTDSSESDGSTAASTCSTGTDPAEVSRDDIDSSSTEKKVLLNDNKQAEAKATKPPIKSKNRALPPLIPARAIEIDPPCQPQKITTSSDDDGSVECSVQVVGDDKEVSPADANPSNGHKDAQMIVTSESSTVISNTASADNNSSESSLFNGLEIDEATPKLGNAKPMMRGRKERAKEKLARRQPKAPARVEEKSATNVIPDSSTSEEKANIITTGVASEKSRKKEKLQKIMDYRKKASPAPERKLPQKTLDAWLIPREKKEKVNESSHTPNAERNVQNETGLIADNAKENAIDASQNSTQEKAMLTVKGSQAMAPPKYVEAKTKKTAFEEGSGLAKEIGKQQQPQQKYSKPIVPSRDFSAPVSRIDVLQTAYSTDTGISLPPELLNGKKVRIWHESETFDEGVSKGGDNNMEALADVFMTCGKPKSDDDMFTYDMNTDVNSIIDERKAWCVNDDESTLTTTKRNNITMCGVDTHQLKKDIIFEVNEVVRDVEDGMRRSMRNLFLTCDITQSGGVEAVTSNVANTNDQLFGRAPIPTKQAQAEAVVKDGNNTRVNTNPSIFDSAVAPRKISKEVNVLPNKLGMKNENPVTADEKRTMYVAKLRAAALKHM